MLAKMGASSICPFVMIVVPPDELSLHLHADAWVLLLLENSF
jgi:hypothetical protein